MTIMTPIYSLFTRSRTLLLIGAVALSALTAPVQAQDQLSSERSALGAPVKTIKKYNRVWVEGPGDILVKYGITYNACAKRCLQSNKCVMLEYYHPKDKCNLYSKMRKRLRGGSSFVGIKQ